MSTRMHPEDMRDLVTAILTPEMVEALHGRVRTLTFSAPNAPSIVVFSHGG